MMQALDIPSWRYLEREPLPADGPFTVCPSRMGYVLSVVDSRTGQVRATAATAARAQELADDLNRREQ